MDRGYELDRATWIEVRVAVPCMRVAGGMFISVAQPGNDSAVPPGSCSLALWERKFNGL